MLDGPGLMGTSGLGSNERSGFIFKIALGPKRAAREDPSRYQNTTPATRRTSLKLPFHAPCSMLPPFPELRLSRCFRCPHASSVWFEGKSKQVTRQPCSGLRSPCNLCPSTLEFHCCGLQCVCCEGPTSGSSQPLGLIGPDLASCC